jgi:copper chaperone NosL
MLISIERGSAQIVSPADDPRFYDDVGCLAADWRAHATHAHAFVRTADAWTPAAAAAFARVAGTRTAMGSGIVAFASAEEARAAGAGESLLTFDEVIRSAEVQP